MNADPAPQDMLYEDRLEPGAHTSVVLRRGSALRLTDVDGGANVATLLYHYPDRLERYNMPDTLKAQHTAFLTHGHVCYSDMGRVLVSIIADTCGWHDPIGGVSGPQEVLARFGEASYQTHRNAMFRNGRDSLLTELSKWGLGARDLTAPINFFSRLSVDESGRVRFHAGNSAPGSYVDLRAEMDVLVVMSGAPHPLDPAPRYAPQPVRIQVWRAPPPAPDDACRNHCPENVRGFINTQRLYAA